MPSLLAGYRDRVIEVRCQLALVSGLPREQLGESLVAACRGSICELIESVRPGEMRVHVAANSRAVLVVDGDAVPHIVENGLGLRWG